MKYLLFVLLLFSICTAADPIPTFNVIELAIHNMDRLLFSGPGISGELRTFGQVPMGGAAFPFTFGPTIGLKFFIMDIFADPPAYPYGTVDRGNGTVGVSYSRSFETCGAGFPGTTEITVTPNPEPAAGTLITISAPVTFCGIFPMWDSHNPFTNPTSPDFYLAFNNLQGTGTYVLESQGLYDFPGVGSVTAYRWISLDYEASAVPEPATLVLCGLALVVGSVKRLHSLK